MTTLHGCRRQRRSVSELPYRKQKHRQQATTSTVSVKKCRVGFDTAVGEAASGHQRGANNCARLRAGGRRNSSVSRSLAERACAAASLPRLIGTRGGRFARGSKRLWR